MSLLKLNKKICGLFLLLGLMLSLQGDVFAGTLVFSTEDSEWIGNEFILDVADEYSATGNIDLKFGQSVSARFRFNAVADKFELNRNVDLEGNELTDFRIENLGSAPTCNASAAGRIYFDTGSTNSYVCDGVSTWEQIDGGAGSANLAGLTDTNITAPAGAQIIIYDGVDSWDNQSISGDVSIATNGAATIQSDSVALTTDTTGNYVQSLADAGSGDLTITNGATEGGVATIDITDDSLDFSELSDGMVVDATTTFDLDTNGADLNFDSNTLVIDSDVNRVGIGVAAPDQELQVAGDLAVGSGTETISDVGFVLDGNDVFIADSLGVEGAIYTDDIATKYDWIDIFGCIRGSASTGTIAGGRSAVVRFDGGNNSQMRCSVALPDDWVSGTDVDFEIFWSPSDNGSGGLYFDFDYASFSVGDTINTGSFTDTSITTESVTASTDAQLYSFTTTVSNGVITANEMLNFRILRNPGNAADTYGADINIHSIRMSYTGKKLR